MELIFDSYSATLAASKKLDGKFFSCPHLPQNPVWTTTAVFHQRGEKKKDAERDFIFHIYFAPMDTVCSRTTQTSEAAGGKIACCNLVG